MVLVGPGEGGVAGGVPAAGGAAAGDVADAAALWDRWGFLGLDSLDWAGLQSDFVPDCELSAQGVVEVDVGADWTAWS